MLETWNVYKQSFPFLKLKFSWVHGHFSDFMAPYLAKISFQISDLCSTSHVHVSKICKLRNSSLFNFKIVKTYVRRFDVLSFLFFDFLDFLNFNFQRNCWYSVKAKIPPKDSNPTNYFRALYNYHLSIIRNNILIWKIIIS